uniref:Uncharacterized protein n=1 Tax=Aegilops tauschii subsp. strangulata TaxID=200361 RepID=A0A453NTL3_AEGTS
MLSPVIPGHEHVYPLQAATGAPSPLDAARSCECSVGRHCTMGTGSSPSWPQPQTSCLACLSSPLSVSEAVRDW